MSQTEPPLTEEQIAQLKKHADWIDDYIEKGEFCSCGAHWNHQEHAKDCLRVCIRVALQTVEAQAARVAALTQQVEEQRQTINAIGNMPIVVARVGELGVETLANAVSCAIELVDIERHRAEANVQRLTEALAEAQERIAWWKQASDDMNNQWQADKDRLTAALTTARRQAFEEAIAEVESEVERARIAFNQFEHARDAGAPGMFTALGALGTACVRLQALRDQPPSQKERT